MRPLLAIVLFGGTAVVLGHDWLGIGGAGFDRVAGGELYDAVVVAAGLACLLRARAVPRERWAWLLIGAAVLCWAGGEIYWTHLYLAFYPLACAGLALLVRARSGELDWRRWTDAAIAALGTAALGTAVVFDFVTEQTTGASLEVATSLAYPLADIAMMAMIVGVFALTGWRPDRTWSLLLAGLALTVATDIAYSVQGSGGAVPPGNWIDPLYMLSAAFIGATLWQPATPRMRDPGRSEGRGELVVPAVFLVIVLGLGLMQYLGGSSDLSMALRVLTVGAVIARLAFSARENRRLVEQVRTDSLTGIGNRGGMQVDLDALCAQGDPNRPVALCLFDLNGFKRYNDSFGHPAGDELLARLAGQLREAVGEDGTVYRIGGDEFCALLTCVPERFRDVAEAAAGALAASDRGVEVASSWGAATIPVEAGEPTAALRLADVRMYAQKESRRTVRSGSAAQPAIAPEPGSEIRATAPGAEGRLTPGR